MSNNANAAMNPWHPMTDKCDLKHLGKLQEELGELTAAVARCLIQGIDECEPETGKPNREWLTDEIADVAANIELVVKRFKLDKKRMMGRAAIKAKRLAEWHAMA